MTVEEYRNYEAPLGYRDELLEGKLILSPSANAWHAETCHRLRALLENLVIGPYVTRLDTTMELDENEEKGNRPRPDVFVIAQDRWRDAIARNGYPEGSPELAVEVLSPSTAATDREIKTPRYLQAGSLAVWLVDGETETITVVTSVAQIAFRADGIVTLPPALGGAGFLVSSFFRS